MPTTLADSPLLIAPLLVALGSNQRHPRHGRPPQVLQAALIALESAGFTILAASPVFITPPLGPPQPNYANACVVVRPPASITSATDALAALKRIERAFGRKPRYRWGQRVLDLDIIGWGALIWPNRLQFRSGHSRSRLVIPHPRAHRRAFVLVPLALVAPDWRHPVLGRTATQLMHRLRQRHGLRPGGRLCFGASC